MKAGRVVEWGVWCEGEACGGVGRVREWNVWCEGGPCVCTEAKPKQTYTQRVNKLTGGEKNTKYGGKQA